jgi:hypothetical protein
MDTPKLYSEVAGVGKGRFIHLSRVVPQGTQQAATEPGAIATALQYQDQKR